MRVSVNQYWRLLAEYVRPQGRRVALLAGLMLAGIGLQLVAPLILRRFIDRAQAGDELGPPLRVGRSARRRDAPVVGRGGRERHRGRPLIGQIGSSTGRVT